MVAVIVIDTNVFVAALRSGGGASRQVLRGALEGRYQPIFSNALWLEYEDLLGRQVWTPETTDLERRQVLAALAASVSLMAFADEGSGGEHGHKGHKRGFMMGVCVGQSLAQQGVTTLPKRPFDAATKAAFKKAAESCRSQFKDSKNPSGGATSTDSATSG